MKFGHWVRVGFCAAVVAALTACGGGGGSDSASGSSGSGSGGSSGGGSGTSTACTIDATAPLVAISMTGVVGTAQFSSGGSQITYANGLNGAFALSADPSSSGCMDSGGNASSMRTALQTGNTGMGISHVAVSGVNQPALLLNPAGLASNAAVSALQGNYTVLRMQQDTSGGGQTRMSYVALSIDANGNWSMCKNAPSCSTPTATGTLSATAGNPNSFDLASAGLVRAKVYLMGTGANRVLVAAENDNGGGTLVTGIHIGMPQTAWAPVAGNYVLNTTDNSVNLLTLARTSISGNGQSHALTPDSPISGLATATAGGGEINYLLATPTGVLVTGSNTGNNFSNGPGFFSFGIKP